MWLTPIAVVWESWRSMQLDVCLAWIAWIWLPAALSLTRAARDEPDSPRPEIL
jgi:hypothetical protein